MKGLHKRGQYKRTMNSLQIILLSLGKCIRSDFIIEMHWKWFLYINTFVDSFTIEYSLMLFSNRNVKQIMLI